MGNNYHAPYTDNGTRFVAVDINPPLSSLDRALTYQKNVMIGCDGAVAYDPSNGRLTWTGTIHIYFTRENGLSTHNSIAAGEVTLSDLQFAYVTLSEINDAVLTMGTATISPGSISNFKAFNVLVLGYRNAADDKFYGPLWPLIMHSALGVVGTSGGYVRRKAEATATITASSLITITLNIPSGARVLGAQLRVDSALATGELWDAAYSGGATTSLMSGAAVVQNTKVNKMHAPEISTDTTNIAITKTGGGSFTAQGTIRAIVYYESFETMANAS